MRSSVSMDLCAAIRPYLHMLDVSSLLYCLALFGSSTQTLFYFDLMASRPSVSIHSTKGGLLIRCLRLSSC
jgi:hypothetical protein